MGWLFGAPPTTARREISIIPQPSQFVNRQNEQSNHQEESRICTTLPVDFWCGLWYTNDVKGRGKGNLNHASGNALDARPRELTGE